MLGVIGNKFSIGKETYQPYAAEMHYFRIEKRYWSICFERIKRAGFRIISTVVPWNIHQDASKQVDFNGFDDPRRDLIVFLELAREFGFKVILRPGPWVASQIPYGGLPKSLFNDIKVFARDAKGQEIELPDQYGVKGGYLPAFMHKNFQFHLRNYFKAFIETTKNYVHPRGPIFMIELDHETSFSRMLQPDKADYNPDVLAEYYPIFLMTRYDDIKKLNSLYKEKNEDFDKVEPPRKFTDLNLQDYPKVLDWFRFRQYLLTEYLTVLEDIFTSYTVEPLFFRSLYFRSGDLLPAFNLVPEDRAPFLGSNVFPEGSYFDLSNKARFLKAEYGFAFATSFFSGRAAADPRREEQLAPVENNMRRFYLAAGLLSGFKGLNHYMFVDREHWYGAPLREDGTVTKGYDVARNFNQNISTVGFEEMDAEPDVAVLGNRMYYWLRETTGAKEFQYIPRLLDETTVGFCRDLMRLSINYGIRENRDFSSMQKYKIIFVPSAEVMAERDQEALVELAKAGVTIIMCGVMPKYDEDFKDCQVLANHFRIKTTVDYRIGTVEHKGGAFPCYLYGNIRTTDDNKIRKLATSEDKVVAVCSTRFKGSLYLLTFDFASGGNHHKLAYVESILEGEKQPAYLYCNDPSISLGFQMSPRKGMLFIVVPPPGELSDGYEARRKEIIIRADLRQAGFTAAKIKLTNLLEDPETVQPIKTTAKDLRTGMPLQVEYPDGIIYLVEKR
jgi:beta-galactosidase GanA